MAALEFSSLLNIHTPTSSFTIVHSLTQETLLDLYNKLSRKTNTDYYGDRVGPGWLKYEYNDAVWNLDDDSDYTIFVWRRQQLQSLNSTSPDPNVSLMTSTSGTLPPQRNNPPNTSSTPTLHLHNPNKPFPAPPSYCNPSYYMFQDSHAHPPNLRVSPSPSRTSTSKKSKKAKSTIDDEEINDGVPKFKKQFERFHSENGVRTVNGSIGPVHNVRMLLKSGYRHVYISRKFAIKHGFIPPDAAPGSYGYGGLVNIGTWPITLTPSSSQPNNPSVGYRRPDSCLAPSLALSHTTFSSPHIPSSPLSNKAKLTPPLTNGKTRSIKDVSTTKVKRRKEEQPAIVLPPKAGPKAVLVDVYLSEEPHFDVVLGRSFFEKRQIKVTSTDLTDVVCLDNGEKIECELVILKDGRGEIVTVT